MGFNLPVLNRRRRLLGTAVFSPAALFTLSEPGIWLDPSDVANLSWRRNLLTYTEQFDNAAWVKTSATVSANAAVAPDGTLTADRVEATGIAPNVSQDIVVNSTSVTLSAYFKKGTGAASANALLIRNQTLGTNLVAARVNLDTGAITYIAGSSGAVSESVGNGWWKLTLTASITSGNTVRSGILGGYPATVGDFSFIWGAQLETGSTATAYQRISDVNTEVLERFPTTTMFQDRAGTIPVTTPGQSVGYRRDKSGRNNHAVANSDAARGIYGIEPVGGRRNLLTFSRDPFTSSAVISKADAGINAPTGDQYVRITELSTTGSGKRFFSQTLATFAGSMVFSFYAKDNVGGRWIRFRENTTTGFEFWFQPSTGTVSSYAGGASSSNVFVQTVATGVYRLSCVLTFATEASRSLTLDMTVTASGTATYVGDNVSGFDVTSAQLELGSVATDYQRVITQYDVTEAGKQTLHYVQYDGSDDGYVTPTITPGIDKVQVFAGVRKLSDAAQGIFVELSTSTSSFDGTFRMTFPGGNGAATYALLSKGTLSSSISSSGFASPITNVVTALSDISGDLTRLRVNGTQRGQDTTDQGTGNFLAYPLYIGRRGGTTLPFNGRDYGIIIRFGANLDASTIAATESWLNQKTGAY